MSHQKLNIIIATVYEIITNGYVIFLQLVIFDIYGWLHQLLKCCFYIYMSFYLRLVKLNCVIIWQISSH